MSQPNIKRDLKMLEETRSITVCDYVSSAELFKIFSRLGKNLKSKDVCNLLCSKIFEILIWGRGSLPKMQYANPCDDEPIYLEHWDQVSLLYSILQRIIKIGSFDIFTSDNISKVRNNALIVVHFVTAKPRSQGEGDD